MFTLNNEALSIDRGACAFAPLQYDRELSQSVVKASWQRTRMDGEKKVKEPNKMEINFNSWEGRRCERL